MQTRRNLPNLHDLLAFDAAARTLNFTQAASALNVQQPAISRRVAQLEDWLGAELFRRHGSQLTLTAAGKRFHETVAKGLGEIEEAATVFRTESGQRIVSVDCSIVFASLFLVGRLDQLRQRQPTLELQVLARSTNATPFSASDIIVFFRDRGQDFPGQVPIFLEELIIVCSPDYAQRHGGVIRTEDIVSHPLLFLNETDHLGDWQRMLGPLGLRVPPLRPDRGFNNFVVYLNAVQSGQGLGLAWRHLVQQPLANGTLIQPVDLTYRSDRGYYAFIREGAQGDGDIREVFDWLVSEGARSL